MKSRPSYFYSENSFSSTNLISKFFGITLISRRGFFALINVYYVVFLTFEMEISFICICGSLIDTFQFNVPHTKVNVS